MTELGAAFLCAYLCLGNKQRPNLAVYAVAWLKVLKNDNRAIFTAAGKAQQAVDFTHSLQTQPTGKPEPNDDGDKPAYSAAPLKAGQLGLSF